MEGRVEESGVEWKLELEQGKGRGCFQRRKAGV